MTQHVNIYPSLKCGFHECKYTTPRLLDVASHLLLETHTRMVHKKVSTDTNCGITLPCPYKTCEYVTNAWKNTAAMKQITRHTMVHQHTREEVTMCAWPPLINCNCDTCNQPHIRVTEWIKATNFQEWDIWSHDIDSEIIVDTAPAIDHMTGTTHEKKMITLNCGYSDCGYSTGELQEHAACSALNSHVTSHAAPRTNNDTSTHGDQCCDIARPILPMRCDNFGWEYFNYRWDSYKQLTNMKAADTVVQLIKCCEEALKNKMFQTYGNIEELTETTALRNLENARSLH